MRFVHVHVWQSAKPFAKHSFFVRTRASAEVNDCTTAVSSRTPSYVQVHERELTPLLPPLLLTPPLLDPELLELVDELPLDPVLVPLGARREHGKHLPGGRARRLLP